MNAKRSAERIQRVSQHQNSPSPSLLFPIIIIISTNTACTFFQTFLFRYTRLRLSFQRDRYKVKVPCYTYHLYRDILIEVYQLLYIAIHIRHQLQCYNACYQDFAFTRSYTPAPLCLLPFAFTLRIHKSQNAFTLKIHRA